MFKIVQDDNSHARHIVKSDTVLCGIDVPSSSAFPTDIDFVLHMKDRQETLWFLCPECASKFTGLDAEEFIFVN